MSAGDRLARGSRRVILPPALWLAALVAAPLLIVLRISLSDPASRQPPYLPYVDFAAGASGLVAFIGALDFENFVTVLTDPLYFGSFLTSLRIAFAGALLTLLLGYPMALAIARAGGRARGLLLALVILPFWTSFLIRVYAWIAILRPEGLLNQALMGLGLTSAPLEILNTDAAILIGIVSAYLPFMILPIYASLVRQDALLLEAAADLGATPLAAFWRVTFPLSRPGVAAGFLLVFIPAMGEFVIPDLLGGSDTLMVGRLVWTEFFSNRDWPVASALAIVLLVILTPPILLARRTQERAR
jgi:putrescine transport system permease protein